MSKMWRNQSVTMIGFAILCFATILFVLRIHTSYALAADKSSNDGRFQIVAVTFWSQLEGREVKRLFRIDTNTGKTWQFEELDITVNGKKIGVTGWDEDRENRTEFIVNLRKANERTQPK